MIIKDFSVDENGGGQGKVGKDYQGREKIGR